MQQLLGNVGFWGFIAAIVTYIISPLLTEKVRKIGEKNNDLLETTVKKIDEQSSKLDKIDNKLVLQENSMLGLMRYTLIEAMSKAIKRKYTTSKEIDDIHDLLEPYRKMGGNGAVDIMYEKFKKLEIDDNRGEIL